MGRKAHLGYKVRRGYDPCFRISKPRILGEQPRRDVNLGQQVVRNALAPRVLASGVYQARQNFGKASLLWQEFFMQARRTSFNRHIATIILVGISSAFVVWLQSHSCRYVGLCNCMEWLGPHPRMIRNNSRGEASILHSIYRSPTRLTTVPLTSSLSFFLQNSPRISARRVGSS